MDDRAAAPGKFVVSFRCDPAEGTALERGLRALVPQINLAGARVDSLDSANDVFRVEFVAAPGTDLQRLVRDCSRAVEDAFRGQDIRTGWSLVLVDDQGRTYSPGQ